MSTEKHFLWTIEDFSRRTPSSRRRKLLTWILLRVRQSTVQWCASVATWLGQFGINFIALNGRVVRKSTRQCNLTLEQPRNDRHFLTLQLNRINYKGL